MQKRRSRDLEDISIPISLFLEVRRRGNGHNREVHKGPSAHRNYLFDNSAAIARSDIAKDNNAFRGSISRNPTTPVAQPVYASQQGEGASDHNNQVAARNREYAGDQESNCHASPKEYVPDYQI